MGLHGFQFRGTIEKTAESVRKKYEIFRKAAIFDDCHRCDWHIPFLNFRKILPCPFVGHCGMAAALDRDPDESCRSG